MMIERIDVDHKWVTDEKAPSHRDREEREIQVVSTRKASSRQDKVEGCCRWPKLFSGENRFSG